jgi:hypothetical protein
MAPRAERPQECVIYPRRSITVSQDGIGDAVILDSKLSDDIAPAALVGRKGESFRQWIMWSKVSTAEMEILAQEWENFERSNAA